ncbi:MAG: formylglycine-generating enzyme family protein [Bacteroidales bacterium]|nr:formylglycine-generating enzyme family protein [Bacteroidales bacterium]
MTHVSGDVGKNISAGKGKRIVWDVLQDCDKLQGDRVCFSVTATRGGDNQTITVNGVSFTMVYVEGGTFTMGCTSEQGVDCAWDEKPAHSVTLSGYYIGETEVTQALWKAVMGSNPSNWEGDQLPVENVSWDDCQTFIRNLNNMTGRTFRLPTEAEWEYAARGGMNSKGYKYSGSNNIDDVAWYDGNSGKKTHAVKGKRANELGLYDMSGNVCEWCSDYWKGDYSSGSQSNPKGPSSGSSRVYRGGSWIDLTTVCRVSHRGTIRPSLRISQLGIRLALVP